MVLATICLPWPLSLLVVHSFLRIDHKLFRNVAPEFCRASLPCLTFELVAIATTDPSIDKKFSDW